MELSIVIVSYNVSHFLQQTLQSVQRAIRGIQAEVWVVDNASHDDSVAMVRNHFPWVKLIANTENVGFSRANNQALRLAQGKYCLLLNPDMLLTETSLRHCLDFMASHPDCGGLGVRMVDGSGLFLPESKRGLPTPWASFCKIMGLGRWLPTSKLLNRYYMGWLPEHGVHEVEVLSGAFMLMPKAVLDQIGLLDEAFFMYGEDVDLSYRITLGGYKNYYLGTTTVLHYKGESTKKGSLRYVKVFYQAMSIFAQKHFGGANGTSALIQIGIQLAIWLRASLSVLKRWWLLWRLPIMDGLLIWIGMYFLKEYWQANHKRVPGDYPPSFMLFTVPAYLVAWLGTVALSGGYLQRPRATAIVRGLVVGMLVISAVTNFFDDWRYSKALILLGTGWSITIMLGWRLMWHYRSQGTLTLHQDKRKRLLLIGGKQEAERVEQLLTKTGLDLTVLGYVSDQAPSESALAPLYYLGTTERLATIKQELEADELVFCDASHSHEHIIQWLQSQWPMPKPSFRIVPEGTDFIIGSGDKNTSGDYYQPAVLPAWANPETLSRKQLADKLLAILCLTLLLPMVAMRRANYLAAAWQVLAGNATWVLGQSANVKAANGWLKGIVDPGTVSSHDPRVQQRVRQLYDEQYSVWQDLKYWWRGMGKS